LYIGKTLVNVLNFEGEERHKTIEGRKKDKNKVQKLLPDVGREVIYFTLDFRNPTKSQPITIGFIYIYCLLAIHILIILLGSGYVIGEVCY
jgi:hypothetical protein